MNRNIFNCSHLSLKSLPNIPGFTDTVILTNNSIKTLPRSIQKLGGVSEMYLSGNPLVCDCKMIWMIKWLNELNNSTNTNLVRDFREVKCDNDKFKGIPIIYISEVLMGCFPSRWTTGQKVGIGTGIVLFGIIFIITVLAMRKSREVKFLLFYYLNLNTLQKEDLNEEIDTKEYDAFLCY